MSRLTSLTPTRASSRPSISPSPSSTPPSRTNETTHHRMLKLLVGEVRGLIKNWDELIAVDALKAGKTCIDEATGMEYVCALAETLPAELRPAVGPHLGQLYAGQTALSTVLSKLDKLLAKLSFLIDQAEKIFFEAYRAQGPDFALTEPLWLTWTLEHFVNSLSPLLTLHNQQYHRLTSLAETIASPETSFDDAKLALEHWQDLSRGGERWDGVREWEELVDLETAGLGNETELEEDDGTKGRRRKGRKA